MSLNLQRKTAPEELLKYLTEQELEELDYLLMLEEMEKCEESLSYFLRSGWKYIDPNPYVHGWHVDAVAEHLSAVTRGEIKRLLINIPPRHGKSGLVSVAWPAWTWAQSKRSATSGPQVQWLYSSYAHSLSLRDSLKCRRLIESPWYKEKWGDRFNLAYDQNTKTRFDNSTGGCRLATSVGGTLIGEGGSIIVVDDPSNTLEINSAIMRENVLTWWDEAMSTRLNDPKTGAMVIIMQRLHEEDLSGHVLEQGGFEHLCLPARFDSDRKCTTVFFEDPREEDGELLWPERYGEDEIAELETKLGPHATASQLQQAPTPRGGAIINREWWKLYDPPSRADGKIEFPAFELVVASLDTAYTEKQENDYSAMTVWGLWRDENNLPKLLLIDAWKKRLLIHNTAPPQGMRKSEEIERYGLVELVAHTCKRWRVDKLLIEDKAAGHSVAQEIRRLYSNEAWSTQLINPGRLDKVARLHSVAHLFAEGVIYAPDRQYADMVIEEVSKFPKGKHDDLVDTVAMGIRWLRDTGWALRKEEGARDYARRFAPNAPTKPLYDV